MRKIYLAVFIYLSLLLYGDIVDIKADRFYANDIHKVAYFEGDAQIRQGVNKFTASKIIVHFDKKKKATKYEAEGGVRFNLVENGIHTKVKQIE